jgi:hypothetical protein
LLRVPKSGRKAPSAWLAGFLVKENCQSSALATNALIWLGVEVFLLCFELAVFAAALCPMLFPFDLGLELRALSNGTLAGIVARRLVGGLKNIPFGSKEPAAGDDVLRRARGQAPFLSVTDRG